MDQGSLTGRAGFADPVKGDCRIVLRRSTGFQASIRIRSARLTPSTLRYPAGNLLEQVMGETGSSGQRLVTVSGELPAFLRRPKTPQDADRPR